VTTRFRINSVALDTTEGEVRYEFPSELTVLAGDTGVGKTTLLELIKFGFGGDAVLADVAVNHVNSVTLDVLIGDAHLKLSRSLAKTERRIARVTDLINQERLPDHRIGRASSASGAPSLNSLLMASLGLPDDMRAAARTKGNTRAGNRITFADVFLFLYVPQSAINQQIAHSEESYREPKRKTVFELLFDITDPDTLALQSKVNELNAKIVEAEKEHQTVLDFLRTTGTAGREETEQAYAQAVAEQEAARTEQAALRQNLEPIADHETRALRDLLDRAEADLAEARSTITELVRQQDEYRAERRRVQTDIDRLQRMQDAGQRLTQIEFTTCPRCMQPLTGRDVPAGHCRVCLQPDPVTTSEVAHLTDQYEFKQLTEQLVEMDDHLNAIAQQLSAIMRAATEREQLVRELTAKIDARTAERIPPRLQVFSDAAVRMAAAQTRQQHLEQALRQWDRVEDLRSSVEELHKERKRLLDEIEQAKQAARSRRTEILEAIDAEFQETVAALGIPSVRTARIDPDNYLPILDGRRYTEFSGPGGGITTATQVAYWLSLLTVALRDRQTRYPTLLMIDNPLLAISDERLAAAVYRRLVRQADASRERAATQAPVQLIIADKKLPDTYRGHYAQLDFSYDHPTVSTIAHPGPDAVRIITPTDED